ncbi:MAG: YihY/virulence factor BrkB family protein, partial [Hymenobacteraceae bacterium]|nr:YihY/virulence factor BrkB family protein [Hymenobacteraceae bacterium]
MPLPPLSAAAPDGPTPTPPPHRVGAARHPGLRVVPLLLRRAADEFSAHDPLRLGAATAFFTTFALPPIIIILVQALGALYSASLARTMLLSKLQGLLGSAASGLVDQIVMNVRNLERSRLVTWLGFAFVIFVATTLFVVIQNSLNQVWQVRARRSTNKLRAAADQRLRSAAELLATGVLTAAAFAADAALALLADYTRDFDATVGYYLFRGLNGAVGLLILTVWCAFTFRTLSAAHVPWPAIRRGALLTAVLISIGEYVLGVLLVARDLGPIYGPAAGIVGVLLFVFYAAMIFYFGACFTKVYAHHIGHDLT